MAFPEFNETHQTFRAVCPPCNWRGPGEVEEGLADDAAIHHDSLIHSRDGLTIND